MQASELSLASADGQEQAQVRWVCAGSVLSPDIGEGPTPARVTPTPKDMGLHPAPLSSLFLYSIDQ